MNGVLRIITSLFLIFFICLMVSQISIVGSAKQIYSTCINPPAYPQLINQSGTICQGNYNYGIGIGASNISINCTQMTLFNGTTWNGENGITISGVRNVTINGCNFNQFRGSGAFVGNTTNYTSYINLNGNKISGNNQGIFVGYNVVNFNAVNNLINSNKENGIVFTSSYIGPLNPYSMVFPRGIYLTNNQLLSNGQDGILFDSFDYYLYEGSLVNPYNLLVYLPFLNNSIQITSNLISNNGNHGIQNIGLNTGVNSIISHNLISSNGFNFNGSGISVISNYSQRISTNQSFLINANFGYIYSNDIISNNIDGISVNFDNSLGNYLSSNTTFVLNAGIISLNYIRDNFRYASSFFSLVNNSYADFVGLSRFYQNDLSNNSEGGIYLNGNDSMDRFFLDVGCNDINFIGYGNGTGIYAGNLDRARLTIIEKNIIEQNWIGIIIDKVISPQSYSTTIEGNYIGFNNVGLNSSNSSHFSVRLNDFDQNTIQALDDGMNYFRYNWWSDYSLNCINVNPSNQWCDISRLIPVNNQDTQSKAGQSFGNKNRGYFVKANTGVIPKQSCSTVTPLPSLPNITLPTFNPLPSPIGV